MAKKNRPDDPDDCPSFEDALNELEQVVAKLEGGKLALAEALAAYELGVKRLKQCFQVLEHAERRIELVQSVSDAGQARTQPLDDAEQDDLAEKGAARSRRRTARADVDAENDAADASSLF
ncbi:MAG: exodeoxyribonuclease VII small subunit [Planctomycetota bacterium]|nr:MAG: exodeoxyribonuclease VII small subunit [Planctomycetota bacterium]